jgi:hypothetical protein
MAAAALTPRVRIMVVCDEAIASETESGVFTLEGVRQHLRAESFPCSRPLSLFLLLSSTRRGTYEGKILVIDDRTDRTIRYERFSAAFQKDNEILPFYVEVACEFPEPGQYTFQVWFSSKKGADVLKGEQPFDVLKHEE